jgi:uncharacterized surface protein with fasciclin (FAS1) repeats
MRSLSFKKLVWIVAFATAQAQQRLVQTLRERNLTRFAELTERAGLSYAFEVWQPGTFFVPRNEAVDEFLAANPMTQLQLQWVVAAHMSATVLNSTLITSVIASNTTVGSRNPRQPLVFSQTNGRIVVNGVNITSQDTLLGRSIGHILDKVIVPRDLNTLVTPLIPNMITAATVSNLTSFVRALELANLTTAFNNMTEMTVFAPENEAFANIKNMTFTLNDFQALLSNHVVPNQVLWTVTMRNGQSLATRNQRNITVNFRNQTSSGDIVINSDRLVTRRNILTTQGILYALDKVILPENNGTAPNSTVPSNSSSSTLRTPPATDTIRPKLTYNYVERSAAPFSVTTAMRHIILSSLVYWIAF